MNDCIPTSLTRFVGSSYIFGLAFGVNDNYEMILTILFGISVALFMDYKDKQYSK